MYEQMVDGSRFVRSRPNQTSYKAPPLSIRFRTLTVVRIGPTQYDRTLNQVPGQAGTKSYLCGVCCLSTVMILVWICSVTLRIHAFFPSPGLQVCTKRCRFGKKRQLEDLVSMYVAHLLLLNGSFASSDENRSVQRQQAISFVSSTACSMSGVSFEYLPSQLLFLYVENTFYAPPTMALATANE